MTKIASRVKLFCLNRRLFFKNTFTYSVKAQAPIVSPPKPVPASATEIKTAETSPQAAVYRKYLKALETGDRNTLRTVVTREHSKKIDNPDFLKMLEVIQELIATDVKLQKLTVNGDTAVFEATGKDRVSGARAAGTIKMALEGATWKIIGEEWKPGGK